MEIGARLDNVYSMGTKINLKKVLTNNKKCDIKELNKNRWGVNPMYYAGSAARRSDEFQTEYAGGLL